jgi:hypothetical protein
MLMLMIAIALQSSFPKFQCSKVPKFQGFRRQNLGTVEPWNPGTLKWRVLRNTAACTSANTPGCRDRVIVALGNIEVSSGDGRRQMVRGDVAVFGAGQSYAVPTGGPFFEVSFKDDPPAVQAARETIAPEKNAIRYDGERFLIFEERLEPGDTRPRHSHNQRVVMQLNRTRLQQWPEGQPEIFVDIVPDNAGFNPPVIHVVKNVGTLPLRGIVIELKPRK